jgi:4-oxalocrotonate tautomerase
MPVVTLKISRGRTVAQKRAAAQAVTEAVASTLEVPPDWVIVFFEEFDADEWAIGGALDVDRKRPGTTAA